jgi:hypothetical protein
MIKRADCMGIDLPIANLDTSMPSHRSAQATARLENNL